MAEPRHLTTQRVDGRLGGVGKLDDPLFGSNESNETVNLVFSLSSGQDNRRPWNAGQMRNGAPIEYVANPEPRGDFSPAPVSSDDEVADAPLGEPVAHGAQTRSPRAR